MAESSEGLLRAISDSDLKSVIRKALEAGWEFVGWTGKQRAKLIWPATGQVLVFTTTPGVASWKTTATEIKKISGVEVWRKGNRKRSHKAPQGTDFDLTRVRHENSDWHRQWGDFAERLLKEHEELKNQLIELKAQGTREAMNKALPVIRKLAKVEGFLQDLHQPFEPFQPKGNTIAEVAKIEVEVPVDEATGVPEIRFSQKTGR